MSDVVFLSDGEVDDVVCDFEFIVIRGIGDHQGVVFVNASEDKIFADVGEEGFFILGDGFFFGQGQGVNGQCPVSYCGEAHFIVRARKLKQVVRIKFPDPDACYCYRNASQCDVSRSENRECAAREDVFSEGDVTDFGGCQKQVQGIEGSVAEVNVENGIGLGEGRDLQIDGQFTALRSYERTVDGGFRGRRGIEGNG